MRHDKKARANCSRTGPNAIGIVREVPMARFTIISLLVDLHLNRTNACGKLGVAPVLLKLK